MDRRTTVGRALRQWRTDLLEDLGGPQAASTQQRAVVDLAVRTKLLLDSIDAWLLQQRSLVNARRKALLPVVRERQQLADSLARYLALLGLERRARPPLDLTSYLAERYGQAEGAEGHKGSGGSAPPSSGAGDNEPRAGAVPEDSESKRGPRRTSRRGTKASTSP